jgi:predicted nucleic-acid-binding protein
MTAVDTNVVVRLLTADNPKQAAAARSLFRSGPIWIAKTVLLETGWVLRSLYGYDDSAVQDAFVNCSASRMYTSKMNHLSQTALALTVHGIEFADALHLTAGRRGPRLFPSITRSFAERYARASLTSQPPRLNSSLYPI